MGYRCTGIAVIKTIDGNVLSYTMAQYDENDNLIKNNIRKSYPVKAADTDVSNAIGTINTFIETMENK